MDDDERRWIVMGNNFGVEEEDGDSDDDDEQANEPDPDMADEPDPDMADEPIEAKKPAHAEDKCPITFNKELPREHSYLGDDLEEMEGRTILDDDSFVSFPLMSLPGVVLLPGQTLPLNLFQTSAISMIKYVLDRDKTFGLVTSRPSEDGYNSVPASIGCTAEVLAVKEESDDRSGLSRMRVKAIGRQRFEVIKHQRQIDGILMANARILSEQVLPDPLEGAMPPSLKRLHHLDLEDGDDDDDDDDGEGVNSNDLKTCLSQWIKSNKRPRIDRLSAATFTHWPSWVYKQYDTHYLMKEIEKELLSWNNTFELNKMPRDASAFSFWVASVLPLHDEAKLHFLTLNSAIQRLRYELKVMQSCTVLSCSRCSLSIASKQDVFSMSVEGPMGAYVNPGGYVHETLTVYKARGLHLHGRPSEETSWFPGYAWTIAQCQRCHSHMGWRFTAAGNRQLKPDKFWGLCRSALFPKLIQEGEET